MDDVYSILIEIVLAEWRVAPRWQKYLNYASLDLEQRFKNPLQKFEIYRKFLRKVENDLSYEAVWAVVSHRMSCRLGPKEAIFPFGLFSYNSNGSKVNLILAGGPLDNIV